MTAAMHPAPARPDATAPRPYQFPTFQTRILANGLRIIVAPLRAYPVVTMLAVIEADRNSGTVGSLRSLTRGEWELALDFAVTGSRQLTLSLDQP